MMKKTHKILVIDDKPDNLYVFEALIKDVLQDVEVRTAQSGIEGLEIAKYYEPDVILLDIIMPGIDGFEVCRRIKGDSKLMDIPVVFITAIHVGKEIRIKALEAGAEAFLSKPVDEAELLAQIRAMVRLKEANDLKKSESIRLAKLVEKQTMKIRRELEARKKTENKFREASENWRKTFNAIKDSIVLLDADKYIIECNEAFISLIGKPKEEIIGQPCYTLVHYSDSPIEVCPFLAASSSKSRETIEIMREGRLYEVMVDPIINTEGEVISFVHIFSDITHNNEVELIQKIQYDVASAVMYESTMQALMKQVGSDFKKVMPQTELYVVLKEDDDQELQWVGDPGIFRDDIKLSLYDVVFNVFKQAKPVQTGNRDKVSEEANQISDDALYEIIAEPVVLAQKVVGVLAAVNTNNRVQFSKSTISMIRILAQEISIYLERLRSNEALIRAKEHSEENDRLKTAFLANMSHEIRTPMNGIMGFTEVLKDPSLTAENRIAVIDIIEKSGKRLFNLINDLIDISLIESRQITLNYSPVDLSSECETLQTIFQKEAAEKKLTLRFVESRLPLSNQFFTDKTKFVSILSNLLKNAIKFTEHGEIIFGYNAEEDMIRFFVKDTGIGIPLEKQKLIFERFVQADNRLSRGYEGAGLGLSIAKAYVDIMDGEITVVSEEQKGTEFIVRLPMCNNKDKNNDKDSKQ